MKAKLPKLTTYDAMDERISYLDMLALMVLHKEFGFGAERLKRYYRAINDMAEFYQHRFGDPKTDPKWGQKDRHGHEKLVLWKLKQELKEIGFDYDAMVDEGDNVTK